MCPKRDDCGRERVSAAKKGRFQARNQRRVQKWGRKGSICPKKGRFWARRGQHVQKGTVPGKKGSARPNRAGTGPKKAKNGAGRGRRVRKGTVPGKKGSARPKKDGSWQERVGTSKSSRDGSKEGQFRARRGR